MTSQEKLNSQSAHQWDTGYPPLPEPAGKIQFPAQPYESAWVSSMDAYDESQMQAFVDADRAARTPADSVPEDAARLTYEQAHAIRQGYEISASDGYFEARPQIDSNDRRKVFQAGFERGWDAARQARNFA